MPGKHKLIAEPFTPVYTRLWEMVEEVEYLKDRLKRNKIRFDEGQTPVHNPGTAGLPELGLADAGFSSVEFHVTSSSTEFVGLYGWALTTGDYDVAFINSLKFALFSGLIVWKSKLTTLQWNDKPYIKELRVLDANQGDVESERLQNIRGWTLLMTTTVRMRFTSSDLSPEMINGRALG